MRALFRQFQETVTQAIQRLEDYVVGLSERVDTLAAVPVDHAAIDARVDALVAEYLTANPLPEIDPESVRAA